MSYIITHSPSQIHSSGEKMSSSTGQKTLCFSLSHTPPIPFYPKNGSNRFIPNTFHDYKGSDTSNSIFCSHCCKNFKSYKIVMLQEVLQNFENCATYLRLNDLM